MTGASRDFGRELYPFLYASSSDGAAQTDLLAAVQRSTLEKCSDVIALRRELVGEYEAELMSAAAAAAARFDAGGKLLAFGNGGSATDADDAAADCVSPPVAGWRSLPALSLPADGATVTAVGNDVGLEHVFVRQIVAFGERGDIALGISTSGNSPNVVAGLAEARRRGMLTVAFAGYDGGAMLRDGKADYCFVARREFVPRIQEGHATLWHVFLELVQGALNAPAR
ncbi:MAG: SIS domain-containing protein [Gemmatimonadota bacterium]|nr:SIS domain-containing protein [Gemmatimonadota bacterium]